MCLSNVTLVRPRAHPSRYRGPQYHPIQILSTRTRHPYLVVKIKIIVKCQYFPNEFLNLILNIENKNRTVEASVKVKFGFKSPNISSTVYYAGCISIMILFWSIGHIFNFQNLTFAEMNTPFPNRLVFFLSTTLAQLWISAILLFYGYLYPDLKFLGFALGFSTGGMCGFTSLNTVSIVWFNRFNIRSIKFFFAHWAFTLFYWALILWVVSPLSIWYIFMNINSYIIWSNIWIVMIALNIIFKTRCIINIWIRNCIAITIWFSCLSILKPNDYFPSLSLNAAVNLSTFHFLCIILIWIQSKCGSRFFLPRSYRRKTYDTVLFKNYSLNAGIRIF